MVGASGRAGSWRGGDRARGAPAGTRAGSRRAGGRGAGDDTAVGRGAPALAAAAGGGRALGAGAAFHGRGGGGPRDLRAHRPRAPAPGGAGAPQGTEAVSTMDTHPETALVPFAKDELAPDERARVQAHLAACEACRRALADVRAVLVELAAAPP